MNTLALKGPPQAAMDQMAVVVLRSLPWEIPIPLLTDSLETALAGLHIGGLLPEPPAVIMWPDGVPRKHGRNHRLMLHEGRAAVRFADAAAADAFCERIRGGVVLPGCGDRPIFGGIQPPPLAASRPDGIATDGGGGGFGRGTPAETGAPRVSARPRPRSG